MGDAKRNLHDDERARLSGDKVISNCCDGNQPHQTLAKDAKVTCDGTSS